MPAFMQYVVHADVHVFFILEGSLLTLCAIDAVVPFVEKSSSGPPKPAEMPFELLDIFAGGKNQTSSKINVYI